MVNNITEDKEHAIGRKLMNKYGRSYCASDIAIRLTEENEELNGMLCCCNSNWCNVNYIDEPASDLDRIFELDRGTTEDYLILKEIAAKYGIK